jgi:hypothetical protein
MTSASPQRDRLGDDFAEVVQVDRLQQILEGSPLHRLDSRFGRGVRRRDDDRQPGVDLLDPVEEFEPGQVRQADVDDHGIGEFLLDQRDRLPGRFRGDDLEVVALQPGLQRIEDVRFVVDDEQFRHRHLR